MATAVPLEKAMRSAAVPEHARGHALCVHRPVAGLRARGDDRDPRRERLPRRGGEARPRFLLALVCQRPGRPDLLVRRRFLRYAAGQPPMGRLAAVPASLLAADAPARFHRPRGVLQPPPGIPVEQVRPAGRPGYLEGERSRSTYSSVSSRPCCWCTSSFSCCAGRAASCGGRASPRRPSLWPHPWCGASISPGGCRCRSRYFSTRTAPRCSRSFRGPLSCWRERAPGVFSWRPSPRGSVARYMRRVALVGAAVIPLALLGRSLPFTLPGYVSFYTTSPLYVALRIGCVLLICAVLFRIQGVPVPAAGRGSRGRTGIAARLRGSPVAHLRGDAGEAPRACPGDGEGLPGLFRVERCARGPAAVARPLLARS